MCILRHLYVSPRCPPDGTRQAQAGIVACELVGYHVVSAGLAAYLDTGMAVPIDPVTRDDSIAGVHRIDTLSIALDGASAYLDVRHAMVDLDAAASIATQHAAF